MSLLQRMIPASDESLVAQAPAQRVRAIFARFWPATRGYRRWFLLGLLFVAAIPAIETAEIWLFQRVVDDVLVARDLGPLVGIAAAYIALTLTEGVASYFDGVFATKASEGFLLSLRTKTFAHLLRLSPDQLQHRRGGDLLTRLDGDTSAIEGFVVSGIADGLAAVLRILFFTGALLLLDPLLALVGLAVAPLFWLAVGRFAKAIRGVAREKRRRSGARASVAEEALGNVALVQAYGSADQEIAAYRREGEAVVASKLAATKLRSLLEPIVNVTELVGGLLVAALGAWALTDGRLSLGELLVFMTYLSQLYRPVRELVSLTDSMFSASAGAERVSELLDIEPDPRDEPNAPPLDVSAGRIEFEGVTFTYEGSQTPALRNLDLEVKPGERVAIVGPSGAGKSTLLKLLLRFADPQAGVVKVDGVDLRGTALGSLRSQVGVLLQESLLFGGSVRDNISYGRRGAADDEIEAAARLAGAHEFISRLPMGYDTPVGARGRSLSGGQRQRVALARLFLRNAPIVVLDEPSTGLDADTTARMFLPLREQLAGRTAVIISHNLATVRWADRIVVMDQGSIVESGTHADLLARRGLYARLFGETASEGPVARLAS